MINLSYTLTPKIRVELDRVDRLRTKILILPMSRESEAKQAWRSKLARTYASLSMSGNPITRSDMARLLTNLDSKKNVSKEELDVVNYLKTQDYVNTEWYVNNVHVTSSVVYHLYYLSCESTAGSSRAFFNQKQASVQAFLDYISKGDDHPVLRAGIAQIQLRLLSPFARNNGRITRLLGQLFLYKNHYDMRGFLVLDDYWRKNIERFKAEVQVAARGNNITPWLEFYTEAISDSCEKALEAAREEREIVGISSKAWLLDTRHKQILAILDNPESSITNRQVQKEFKVSQITASRDLAKLSSLGLVFRHGKGRSVRYTRV